jgi:cold shock CspA family protein
MSQSQISYNKKEKEKARLKKRLDKQQKKEERKNNPIGGLDNMIAYVDEFGNITDTPPDPSLKTKIIASNIELGVPKREKEVTPTERTGKVEFYNNSKGFGFIREQNTQEKYFVHARGLLEDIMEGDIVAFELERGMKGMNAVRVKKIK